jgi:hypothetical protein
LVPIRGLFVNQACRLVSHKWALPVVGFGVFSEEGDAQGFLWRRFRPVERREWRLRGSSEGRLLPNGGANADSSRIVASLPRPSGDVSWRFVQVGPGETW